MKSLVLVHERPAFGILQVANEERADLIALTTHGRGFVSRLLLGSIADEVVHGATVPVLVYRPEDARPEAAVHEWLIWSSAFLLPWIALYIATQRTRFDIESFIFSFAIGGIGAVLYNALTRRHFAPIPAERRREPLHRFHRVARFAPCQTISN